MTVSEQTGTLIEWQTSLLMNQRPGCFRDQTGDGAGHEYGCAGCGHPPRSGLADALYRSDHNDLATDRFRLHS